MGWLGCGSKKVQKLPQIVVYYVYNLYQTARFVNLQSDSVILLTTAMFVDVLLHGSHNVSVK